MNTKKKKCKGLNGVYYNIPETLFIEFEAKLDILSSLDEEDDEYLFEQFEQDFGHYKIK